MTEGVQTNFHRADPIRQAALFWQKVDLNGPNGCWLYTGFRKWDGYGWLARAMNGKVRYMTAHRYAWILTHGMPPEGMHILHSCDNPPCCNPAHLRLGTHADNMSDQRERGRHVHGERTKRNKLTVDQVLEIRRRHWKKTHKINNTKELAKEFGVATGTITSVVAGRVWKITTPAIELHPGRVRPRRAA